ncbi:MAG TPA: hypothetical protein HPP54_02115 [Nitrospinae bacterium]|nr:hypothetical protein [Nitrospinota bacterium]
MPPIDQSGVLFFRISAMVFQFYRWWFSINSCHPKPAMKVDKTTDTE